MDPRRLLTLAPLLVALLALTGGGAAAATAAGQWTRRVPELAHGRSGRHKPAPSAPSVPSPRALQPRRYPCLSELASLDRLAVAG